MVKVPMLAPELADRVAYVEELAEAAQERQHEVIPMDSYLGIDKLPFKMTVGLMDEVAWYCAHETSFESAREVIEKKYGEGLSCGYLQKIAYYTGGKVDREDQRGADKIEADWTGNAEMPEEATKEGYFLAEMDGSAINTVIQADGTTWEENKLGLVTNSDNMKERVSKKSGKARREITKKEYVTYLGNAKEFEKRLFEAALRNGYGEYKQTVVVADGAPWIWNICGELFPDAVAILDFFHLEENIYSFAKYIFKNDAAKYKPWAEKLIAMASDSQRVELLKEIKPYKNRKRPKGVVNLWHYVTENLERIDYRRYREEGFPIGSGAIESGNKKMPQERCRGPGMRWQPYNAQNILALKAKMESGLWSTVMRRLVAA